MMGAKAAVDKDMMMMKLKESISLKSFSSKRYYSSLICRPKTIRMDMNLIGQNDLTSAVGSSASNYTEGSSGNLSENQKASGMHEKNSENSKFMNKSAEFSRITENSRKSGNMAGLSKIGDSLKSSPDSEKFKLTISVNSHDSFNQTQTKESSKPESFRCDVCMKYFSSKRSVQRHNILHSSERQPCEICGKEFATSENLQRHQRANHEVKVQKAKCSKCNKGYASKTGLNRHLKKYPDHLQLSP